MKIKNKLSIVYIVLIILSNIGVTKIIGNNDINATGGILLFPIVYILNDILCEVLEKKEMNDVIKLGLFSNILLVVFTLFLCKLPYPIFYQNQESFKNIFISTPRIVLAGFISYYIGSQANALIMYRNKDKSLFFRMMLSTLIGEFLDGLLFVTIGFLGIYSIENVINMIMIQVIFKTLYELCCYTISSRVIKSIKRS